MGRKPKSYLKNKVIEAVESFRKPVTTKDVKNKLNISWNTAQKYLEKAAKKGKIKHFVKEGERKQHLWMTKSYP